MYHKSLENNRTEEVSDIIERMPTKFGRMVTFIVVGLILLAGLFGWIVKYPDVQRAEISITSKKAPVKIMSLSSGKILLLFKHPGSLIKSNSHIAYVKNTANYSDVVTLDSILKVLDIHRLEYSSRDTYFPKNLTLGELNNYYYSFINIFFQNIDYYHEHPFEKQAAINNTLVESKKKLLTENIDESNRLQKKYGLASGLNKRDSLLYEKKLLSTAELEKSLLSKLSSEQEYRSINREITNNHFLISEAESRLQQISIQKTEKERDLNVNLTNAYYGLQEAIKEWYKKYVLVSTTEGKLEFLNFLKDDDFVQQGQELFSIVPKEDEIIGQVYLPDLGSGKVKLHQVVIVKLNNYPYMQYGSIKGEVDRISPISGQLSNPDGKGITRAYLLDIKFPGGLKTNYGTTLNFQFEAKGLAEIITSDRRLIERLFDNLKYGVQ